MAVYAAYRHIELDNVGAGKKRVLKPPGGGSSNIFGAPDVPEPSPRRRNQSHLQSSVLPGYDMGTPARAKPDGNPVTGEGYVATNAATNAENAIASAGDGPSTPAVNGTTATATAPAPAPAPAPQQSNAARRVPPGGFSSGLW